VVSEEAVRTLDCVDCHNRATHRYEDPEEAVDRRLAEGLLPRTIPFAKREYLKALTAGYPDTSAAMRGIETGLRGGYRRAWPRESVGWQRELDRAVPVLREIHRRSVFPTMQVTWNTYPDHIGHAGGGGCFRCHNADMVDAYGESIAAGCTLCHSILAYDSPEPFRFLLPLDEDDPARKMHAYLRDEFLSRRH
jgi:hypothetical protein